VKPWSAVINHSRASGKPPQTAEFNAPDALRTYLEPGNDVVSITIYRRVDGRARLVPPPTTTKKAAPR
jgi:hypothetical protein